MAQFKSINQCSMNGRLVRDPIISKTKRGTTRVNFTMVNNQPYRTNGEWKEESTFVTVTVWDSHADELAKLAKKPRGKGEAKLKQGTPVLVSGQFESSSPTIKGVTKYYQGIKAHKVTIYDDAADLIAPTEETQPLENEELGALVRRMINAEKAAA